jgi:putative CocE/NonD family hydrolase
MSFDREKSFYLSGEQRDGAYLLSTEIGAAGDIHYAYNPESPVPSHGAESMLRSINEVGSLLQPNPCWRQDVISFVSESLVADMAVTGKIHVKLHVSTDAEDTAFTAKVMEVFPDGNAYNIRSSIVTVAHRCEEDTGYTPGEVVPIDIIMWDIDWLVKAGSKLRVDISSSDFPQYAAHSNFPGVWSEQEKVKRAVQHIYFGAGMPSEVRLPISTD